MRWPNIAHLVLCILSSTTTLASITSNTRTSNDNLSNSLLSSGGDYSTGLLRFDNHELWQVAPTTSAQMTALNDLQENNLIDIWGSIVRGNPILIRIPPVSASAVQFALDEYDISRTLMSSSIQDLLDEEQIPVSSPMTPIDSNTHSVDSAIDAESSYIGDHHQQQPLQKQPLDASFNSTLVQSLPFFTKYQSIEALHSYFKGLAGLYPHLVETFSIGKTYEGRDILGIHIHSKESPNKVANPKEIVFHGGTHAREWIAPAVVSYIATQLLSKYGKNNDVTTLLDTFVYSIIPVLNIDGYVYTHKRDRMWRKTRKPNRFACVGTDPNRNWEYGWGSGGSSKNPCSDAYMGPEPFSEPEPRQLAAYVQSHSPNVISYIDFHAFSQLWMFPYGNVCNSSPPDNDKLMRVSNSATKALKKTYGTSFTVGQICQVIYQASGSSVDHVYARANVTYSFAVELRDTGRYGFVLPPRYIVPSGEETFSAVVAMSMQIIQEM
ncbi:hypothetical protein BASA50_004513 [Batrachochytrium salamandrivorans]|uniref:Peptidase M14 domain-containing protein n=1 Tax=Batrachochytrium salamandrivorans TaxID=1357716 RepID=A0ABQ8FIH1_9FUNG|nr:hypothetical protein BASA60_010577 [Batrachochytrium salamandrivorans]KAH6565916.1 hypothetical protein BASA62_006999 [Batrachochytrium salamandrivorans]KAH6597371.1 hypothetical protein BASA50_004513 [Batrachochytrium salamandrivorans]KAH9247176.1 hypothetical protein BASA81_015233 [Batrachochytrium salamandrivorans]KAH9266216.1 hypothetical protein BASA84_001260 [Batrachochytrium salamandrivorans]